MGGWGNSVNPKILMAYEPIDPKKAVQGLVEPKTHIKAVVFAMIIGFWAFVGYAIYKGFIKKPEPTNKTTIVAKKGSEVKVTNITKPSKFFIPFIEVGIEKNNNTDLESFIRTGVRIEF